MEHQSAAAGARDPGTAALSTALDTGSSEPDSASLTASVLSRISEINAEHRLAAGCAKQAVEHAIKCGRLLLEVQAELPHGEFMRWIGTNCNFKQSTASRYMRAAKQFSTGVEISSLSALFPSGRSKKTQTNSAEPTTVTKEESPEGQAPEFRVYEGDSPLMTGAPSARVTGPRGVFEDEPAISFGVGRGKRTINASQITTRLIDEIISAVESYESTAAEFQVVAQLTGFRPEDAQECIDDFGSVIRKLERLHKRLASIAKANR
jgi:hypothetical protein